MGVDYFGVLDVKRDIPGEKSCMTIYLYENKSPPEFSRGGGSRGYMIRSAKETAVKLLLSTEIVICNRPLYALSGTHPYMDVLTPNKKFMPKIGAPLYAVDLMAPFI